MTIDPELAQVVSILVCFVGIGIWIAILRRLPQFTGWFLLPISVFIVNAGYYIFVLVSNLRLIDLDLYLFIGSVRTLYSLLMLVISSGVMFYEIRKRR